MIRKVLIIDDDPGFVDSTRERLDYEGYEVVTAADGDEGLDQVEKERPDLVVLDILMPKLNGYAFLKMLRQRHTKVEVIICTAREDVMDAVKSEGIAGFLVKPFDPAELVNMVNVTFQLQEEMRHARAGSGKTKAAATASSAPAKSASPKPASEPPEAEEADAEEEGKTAKRGKAKKEPEPEPEPEKPKMPAKVLVIDDEVDFAEGLKERLEFEGYTVTVALNGQDGIELARKEHPDLILLDVMMPKIDGYMVARLLKFDEKYQNIPIIMLTARSLDEDRELGLSAGADEYVTKPLDFDELLAKMREVLADAGK